MIHRGEGEVKPCFWMTRLLSRLADGRTSGPLGWYARNHAQKCPNCSATLKAFLALRKGLSQFGKQNATLGESRWAAIENECR